MLRHTIITRSLFAGSVLALTGSCWSAVVVDYTVDALDAGASLDGLSAQAEFSVSGTDLTVLLRNTSTGTPLGAEASDSLLTSLAFDLGPVQIVSGDSALIALGSNGLGAWSSLGAGSDVGDQWLWTNDNGGDFLKAFTQVISTSNGQGGGVTRSFNGVLDPNVGGPFGGIAADPLTVAVPKSQRAVSDAIVFTLTLSESLSEATLAEIAANSVVEFGSDYRYIAVPAPASAFALLAVFAGRRRRR